MGGPNSDEGTESLVLYTVSWRIRIFNCIEEVPRFFFFIQFKIKLKNLNRLQLKLNQELI